MNEQEVETNKVVLSLTEWEVANFHLPPVTTVTLYEGEPPLGFLTERITALLEANPWLTGRIEKKKAGSKLPVITYAPSMDFNAVCQQHLQVATAAEVGLALDMGYDEIVKALMPVSVCRSPQATDADEVLFKVTLVPFAPGERKEHPTPLQEAFTSPGFALVVSMNHTLGDGHTYYHLYRMLGEGASLDALNPVRVDGYEAAKAEVVGSAENGMLSGGAMAFGILRAYLGAKMGFGGKTKVSLHTIDPAWARKQKDEAKQDGTVPFVSTNDALTSWFFTSMESDINLMVANFRSREPSVLSLTDTHAGNYEANIPYFKGDVEYPSLIRQSISTGDGRFRARRAGGTPIPGTMTLLKNRASIVSNWATFYTDLNLRSDGEPVTPRLHFPIMESNGIISSIWNSAIVFRPRAKELAALLITRKLDSDAIAERKRTDGVNVPFGDRLI